MSMCVVSLFFLGIHFAEGDRLLYGDGRSGERAQRAKKLLSGLCNGHTAPRHSLHLPHPLQGSTEHVFFCSTSSLQRICSPNPWWLMKQQPAPTLTNCMFFVGICKRGRTTSQQQLGIKGDNSNDMLPGVVT